jgi:hypothetical protein
MQKLTFNWRFAWQVSFLLFSLPMLTSGALAQTTNSWPTNLFLTDDGRLIWYRKGEPVVAASRIAEALRSPESRPSDQDAQGHWGTPIAGVQLSLRLEKQEYFAGEPVNAIILIRNVSELPVHYLRAMIQERPSPIDVSVAREGRALEPKNGTVLTVISATPVTLLPRTQHKYSVRLDAIFDLAKAGSYIVQAAYHNGYGIHSAHETNETRILSGKIQILIKPGTATEK